MDNPNSWILIGALIVGLVWMLLLEAFRWYRLSRKVRWDDSD